MKHFLNKSSPTKKMKRTPIKTKKVCVALGKRVGNEPTQKLLPGGRHVMREKAKLHVAKKAHKHKSHEKKDKHKKDKYREQLKPCEKEKEKGKLKEKDKKVVKPASSQHPPPTNRKGAETAKSGVPVKKKIL